MAVAVAVALCRGRAGAEFLVAADQEGLGAQGAEQHAGRADVAGGGAALARPAQQPAPLQPGHGLFEGHAEPVQVGQAGVERGQRVFVLVPGGVQDAAGAAGRGHRAAAAAGGGAPLVRDQRLSGPACSPARR